MGKQTKHFYQFDSFCLDATERVLLKNGEPLSLTPKAIETLLVLVENNGHIVDKDDLIKTIWPDTFVSDDSLTRNISMLRKTFGDSSSYIETLPRRGYRFTAAISECWDDAPMFVVERHARLRIREESSDSQEINKTTEQK